MALRYESIKAVLADANRTRAGLDEHLPAATELHRKVAAADVAKNHPVHPAAKPSKASPGQKLVLGA